MSGTSGGGHEPTSNAISSTCLRSYEFGSVRCVMAVLSRMSVWMDIIDFVPAGELPWPHGHESMADSDACVAQCPHPNNVSASD